MRFKTESDDPAIHVVGIGRPGADPETLADFFSNLSRPPDCAFILVGDIGPQGKNKLLGKSVRARMDSVWAGNGMVLQKNRVHVVPPDSNVFIDDGKLRLEPKAGAPESRDDLDVFFGSLADAFGDFAVGILFPDAGGDGVLGLERIEAAGGLTMVHAGDRTPLLGAPPVLCADVLFAPSDMAVRLLEHLEMGRAPQNREDSAEVLETDELYAVIDRVFHKTGRDFSNYKRNTLLRRVEKRMVLREKRSLEEYRDLLAEDDNEARALSKDLLIGVTQFFRDRGSFDALDREVLPRLFSKEDNGIRVWVPGCATGEEAVSLAILLLAYKERHKKNHDIRIFATDIDDEAIERARGGLYPAATVARVPEEYLAAYFRRLTDSYALAKEVRELLVFASHDIIADPPFFKMDLISCRNLLIYLTPEIQHKIVPFFFYALNPDGHLILGQSETLGRHESLFQAIDPKWKIFRRKDLPMNRVDYPPYGKELAKRNIARPIGRQIDHRALLRDTITEMFGPPSVLVDDSDRIVLVSGPIHDFLGLSEGYISSDIFRAAREPIRLHLRSALRKARETHEAVVFKNLKLPGDDNGLFDLVATPVPRSGGETGLLMLSFPRHETTDPDRRPVPDALTRDEVIRRLEDELRNTGEELQTTIEELESANEELKTSNEELMSMNEELQSTNEELETSREELQAMNEELGLVNTELQARMVELNEARNDLENLLRSSEVATIFIDRDFVIKQYTPAASRLFNLIETDVGRPLEHLTSKVPGDRIVDDFREVLRTLVRKEKEVYTEDGFWFLCRIFPYRTMFDSIEGIVLTYTDITERKRLEEELRLHRDALERMVEQRTHELQVSEARYRTLIDHFPNGSVMLFDGDLRCLVAGGEVAALIGLTPERLEGRTVRETLDPDLADRLEPVYREALAGQPSRFNLERGGEEFDVWVLPVKDSAGEVAAGMVMTQVVTEWNRTRRQLEASKKEAESRALELEATISSIPDGVIIYGPDAGMLMINQGARDIMGWRDMDLGKTLADRAQTYTLERNGQTVPPEELPVMRSLRRERLSNEQYKLTRRDGSMVWIALSAAPVLVNDEVIGSVLVFKDVTELVEMQDQLREARDAAQGANMAKTIFLANMSHEIRTPLNGILGLAKLMLLNPAKHCNQEKAQYIQEAGQQLKSIVEDLLDISRIEAHQVAIKPEPTSIREVVEYLKDLHGPTAEAKDLFFITRVDRGIPDNVRLDKMRFRQVLSNLLSNAVKFTRRGGVTLAAEVETMEGEKLLRVTVADTGIGISPEDRDAVFETFYQVENYLTKDHSGAGLGLAITKKLVQLMGGKIEVDSEPGAGSLFTVIFPCLEVDGCEDDPACQEGLEEIAGMGPLKVLLVEDNAVNRIYMRETLKDAGIKVDEARDGQTALDMLAKHPYDLVFMDVQMPIMDGVEATTHIRNSLNERIRQTAIIALTAYAMAEDKEKFLRAGMDGYLSKPFEMKDLVKTVKDVLAKKKVKGEA